MAATPRKRKSRSSSNDDDEPTSKAAKLEAIRARVRDGFAKDDKAKLEARRAMYSDSGAAAAAAATTTAKAEPKSSPALPPAKSKKKADVSAIRRKVANDMDPKKKAASAAKQPTPVAKKSPARKQTTTKSSTAPVPAAVAPSVTSPTMPVPPQGMAIDTVFAASLYSNPLLAIAGMEQVRQQQQQLQLHQQQQVQQQNWQNNMSTGAAMALGLPPGYYGYSAPGQGFNTFPPQQMQPTAAPAVTSPKPKSTPRESRAAKKPAPSSKKGGEDNDGEVNPPSEDELQRRISRQVLENVEDASKGRPPRHTKFAEEAPADGAGDESVSVENDQPAGTEDADVADVQKYEDERRMKKIVYGSAGAALLAALAFGVSQQAFSSSSFAWDSGSNEASQEDAPCYLTNTGNDQYCVEKGRGTPCPTGGICGFGEFSGCGRYYKQVGSKHLCALTKQGKTILDALANQISEQSKQHESCDPDNRPIFYYADLQKLDSATLPLESESLIKFLEGNEFMVQHSDNHLVVGLPTDHPANQLPFSCYVERFAHQSLEAIGTGLWSTVCYIGTTAWSLGSAYPWYSAVGFLVVVLFVLVQRKRAARASFTLEVANVRDMAYGKLVEEPGRAHVLVHIRDEIARDLHPNSRKGQEHIIVKVWPKVVKTLKRDTRVKKSTKMIDGHIRDLWQWNAAPPSAGKKAKFADD
jgi:hypothetical protein